MKKVLFRIALVLCALTFITASADAVIIQTLHGFSITSDAIDFSAQLSITGDLLTVQLFNNSPLASNSPDDLLSSYFFDVVNSNGQRPNLVYLSATGDVYLTHKDSTDTLQAAGANLKAVNAGDYTWQYRALNPSYNPFTNFGLGTVGNSIMAPNNFSGNIAGGMDYSIYTGDIYTKNLDGKLLVKTTATFVFSGLTGFTEADIQPTFGFGMGTAPDSILIPEPATISILAIGALALIRRKK